jgi:hypothetical protein
LYIHTARTISGNLAEYCRLKPTDKYFSQLENIKIAERLLMIKPTKDLRQSEHTKFWQEQKTYRKNSISTLMKKNFAKMKKKN